MKRIPNVSVNISATGCEAVWPVSCTDEPRMQPIVFIPPLC